MKAQFKTKYGKRRTSLIYKGRVIFSQKAGRDWKHAVAIFMEARTQPSNP